MLGVSGTRFARWQTILPMRNFGVTMMSLGLTTNDQAVVWRGPMLMGALQQMPSLCSVRWMFLIADLPPGHWRRK
jgi:ATP-binding protein involved in chromosome partitioning